MRKPNKDLCVGYRHTTPTGSFTIVDYIKSSEIIIRFDNSTETLSVPNHRIRKGNIKNPQHPSVYSVGYFGYGEHKAKICGKDTKVYKVWHGMMQRCYSDMYKHTSYGECTVSDEWHDFQVFADWFVENYKDGCELDKDTISIGNKTYSPEYCKFIDKETNASMQSACQYEVVLISSYGVVVKFTNQRKFCKENGLCPKKLNAMIKGKTKTYNEWRLFNE